MKVKSLLLACALLIAGISQVFAVDAPKASPVNLEGGIQYLYNVGAKGFFVGSNNWTTRASISTTKGWQTKFVLNSDNLYTFQDLCESKNNAWKNVMCETTTAIYTDAASQPGQHTWNVEVADDNTFKIVNTLWENTYLTWDVTDDGGDGNFTICNMVDPTTLEEGSMANVWYAVSELDYNVWYLVLSIENAEAECPGIDLANFKAIAAKADVTLEEVKQALTALPDAIDAWKKSQINWDSASVSSPTDLTALLVNPGFDNQTYEGWAGSGYGKGGTTGPCAERYELVHDTYQKVSNVRPGVYVVKMDGFFRNGSTDNAFNTKGQPSYAYLYGTNNVDTCKTAIMGLFDGIVPEDPVEGVTFTYVNNGETYYIPNSMKDACAFFDAGKYKDNTVYFGVTGDELTIGTFMKEKKTADWMLVDNFRLEYLGTAAEAYQAWNDKAMASTRTYEEGAASAYVLEAYNAAVAAAKTATNYEEVIANVKAVDAAQKDVEANIAAWKALNDQITLCKTTVNGLAGADAEALSDYLDFDIEDMLNAKTATTEEILAQITILKEMLDKAVENGLKPNSDVTDLIKNASFKAGFEGWTTSAGKTPGGTLGGLKAFPCVEVYSGVVDVQQVVTGLPKGVYRLSCQAFERPGGNGEIGKSWDAETPSMVSLFMNSAETPVQNILKDGLPEDKALNQENCFIEGSIGEDYYNTGGTTNLDHLTDFGTYIPNGMSGASYAFRAKRYYQEAAGLVTDGKMTIGLTSKGKSAHWVLWADFKLTFLGNDVTVVKPLVEDAIAALATDKPYGTDVKEIVDAAVAAAKAAIESGDGGKMVDALDALYAAKEPLANSIALFEELSAAVEEFGDVIAESQADEAVKAEATAYWASIDMAGMTNAQAEEAIKTLAVYKNKLAIPAGYKDATPENPVEMTGLIQNADIDAGATVAWQYTKTAQNGPALGAGMNGTPSIEFWNPEANNCNFNIWQEIAYLPAGTYMLKADVANSLNGQEDNGETGRAVLYLMQDSVFTYSDPVEIQEEGCVDKWNNYSVTASLKEGKATIGITNNGKMAARWIVIDNFELYYLGETVTGIIDINATGAKTPVSFYDISGARIAGPQKGINIIKLSNGKVQKVLVK